MEVHITILTCKICQDQIILNTDNPKSWYPRIDFEEAGEETSKKTDILLKYMVLIVLHKY